MPALAPPPRSAPTDDPLSIDGRRPLLDLVTGARGRLDLSALSESERLRVQSIGLWDGCAVTVCRAGTPCIVRVHQTRVGLGPELAGRIWVDSSEVAAAPR